MPDEIQSYKVICSGGLNSNENHLDLSDNYSGEATRLVNYEPSLFGGYRRIEGFSKYDSTYGEVTVAGQTTGQGKVLGLAIFKNDATGGGNIIIAARQDAGASTYSFYYYTAYIGWRKYALNHGATRSMSANGLTVDKLRHVQFNFGGGNRICFVDGVNEAIIFDGINWEELKSSNSGGYTAGSNTNTGGGNQCLNAPSLVDVFQNHLFLSGHTATGAAIAHSAPTTSADTDGFYDFTAASGAGQLAAGFDVVQIKPFRDNIFVCGTNAIKKITVTSSAEFSLNQVTANVGCVSADSVVEIGGDLMFLAPDGFRPVSGTSRIGDVEISSISKKIQATLVDLIKNEDISTLNSVVIRSKSQVRYFIGDSSAEVIDSIGIIGGLTENTGSLKWEFGETVGIRASCCTSEYIGTQELVLHADYDGFVYQQEKGINFNGADIVSVYATPYLDFGETEQRKIMRKLNTFLRAEGPMTMDVALSYDWGNYDVAVPNNYSATSLGGPTVYKDRDSTYNGLNILYGGASKPIMTSDIQGSGFSVRATFVSIGQTEPHTIQGLVIEFSLGGRR